jgi:diacylglycerol kinase (ATP)
MKNDPDFDPEEKITTKYVRKQRNTSRTRRSIHKIVDITDDDISDDDEVDGVDGVDDNEGKKKGNNVEKIEKKIVKQITNIIPPPPPPAKTTTTTPTTTPTYFPSSSPQDFQFSHHWVQGNHSSISDICFLCGSAVGSVFYRDGMHCLWCGLHVHEHCLHDRQLTSDLPLIPQVSPTSRSDTPAFSTHVDLHCCNLGSLAKAIIPPHCIYPGEGYTVPLAKYQIAANFTHEAIAAEKISRGEVALPPSSFNVNPKLDFPQLFKFTLPLWCYPLLVIINRKSGGNGGVEKMHDFVECLNPLQVWDLSVHPAELPLTLFKQSGYPFRVLVCGGDGTISSVLHSIDHVFGITPGTSANEYYTNPQLVTTDGGFSITIPNNNTINTNKNQKHSLSDTPTVPPPACAVLPLGTGNDLAQVLGWGGRNPTATPRQILSQIISGRLAVLDRWNVKLIPNPTPPVDLGPLPQPPIQWAIGDVICRAIQPFVDWLSPIFPLFMPVPSKPCDDLDGIMNNYVGFGLDAVIAHQFADLRKKYPHFFTSQAGNKLWYTRVGFGQWIYPVIRNGLKEAPYTTRVFVDGVELQGLETLQGVVCMGIKSFGGGICFWGDRARDENTAETDPTSGGKFQPPALDDGMFELIGFESSLHMAMIQTGSALPRRLAQGRRLEVEILGKLPMQIDGESWGVRENCRVIVELRTQSLMIVPLHSGPTQTQSDNLGYSPLTQEINVTNMLHEVMQDSIQTGVISSLQSSQLMIGFTKKFTKANPSSHFYPPSHDLD